MIVKSMEQKTWRNVAYLLAFRLLPATILREFRTTCLRLELPIVDWALLN